MPFQYNPITQVLDLTNTTVSPPGSVEFLTGNSGGQVGPDGSNNINIVGNLPINVVGTPGNNTLSITFNGSTFGQTITGDSGGALPPTAGNWNIIGGTGVTTSGAGSTLTINASAAAATTYQEDTGSATSAGNILNLLGTSAQGLSTSGAGNTVTFTNATATTGQRGVLFLATNAQAIAGSDAGNAVTSAALAAKLGTQTAHSLAIFEGVSSALVALGAATNGQLPIGSTGADPVLATLTAGTGVTITNGAGSITIATASGVATTYTEDTGTATPSAGNLNILGTAVQGISTSGAGSTVTITAATATTAQKGVVELATNAQAIAGTDPNNAVTSAALAAKLGTQTAHSIAIFEGTSSALTALGAATNGQLPIGSTGADPVLATITAGTGISITNGAGSITIASVGEGLTWQTITASQTLAVKNGYICISPGGALALALPTVSAVGDIIEVTLDGATSFSITQGVGQQIRFAASVTTSGAGGSITTTAQGDTLRMVCSVANTRWNVLSSIGNLTIV